MNESLKKLLLKLSSDEKLFLQLINKDSIAEMHKFCLTLQEGDYSKEELEQILIRLIRELINGRNLSDKNLSSENLSDENLSKVGGGSWAGVGSFLGVTKGLLGVVSSLNPMEQFENGVRIGNAFKGIFDNK
ncbi:MAG: hypothetical protein LBR79_05720 [Oscillospiraceae bacterium]|jgi:hypothetical protein|nr:hypothetical protein [Oscillospiraceae bacterium]